MKKFRNIILTGMLFISGLGFGQGASADNLEQMVTRLASDELKGRGFGSEEGKIAADYIIDHFKEYGVEPFLEEYRDPFDHRTSVINVQGNNIVGLVKGSNPELANEYIILGAHYDHVGWEVEDGDTIIYNGADDNASGVASIIELGRLLAENRGSLGRSVILIAFDGEESGLLGSKAFVEQFISGPDAIIRPEDVAVMFSLDMVGMYSKHEGIELGGIQEITNYMDFVSPALENSPVTIKKYGGGLENRTDTAPFGKVGIPAIHVFTGTESPYHKPEDDSDLLDYQGMAEIVDFMSALTLEISKVPEVMKSKTMESMSEKGSLKIFNPGFTLQTGGSHHDFKNDYYKAKSIFAYAAGISLETRITQWLAIQPEALYEWSGSHASGGILRTHSLTVPVSILFTTPDPSGMGVRTYYQIGGYYSYAFSGNNAGVALDFVNDYKDTDYGLVMGVGMEIMNFRIGWVMESSMVDFTINEILDTRLVCSYAKIGWVF